jgi:hypothetical protein
MKIGFQDLGFKLSTIFPFQTNSIGPKKSCAPLTLTLSINLTIVEDWCLTPKKKKKKKKKTHQLHKFNYSNMLV